MKLLLIVTALLFYTMAEETKECPSYVLTEAVEGIDKMKEECGKLNGVMASEDLKNSENAEKAKVKVKEAFDTGATQIFLGITSKKPEQNPDENDNPFVFSDGENFDEGVFPYSWAKNRPMYAIEMNCVHLYYNNELYEDKCGAESSALCYVGCPKPANSGSELSRANLPLFALYALAALIF